MTGRRPRHRAYRSQPRPDSLPARPALVPSSSQPQPCRRTSRTQGHRTGPTATAVSPKAGKVVTWTFTLAGYTMTYHQAAGAQQLYGEFVAAVPSDAEPVDAPVAVLDGVPVTEYVGVDPTTGYNAAYVAPVSGRILEITSSDATHDELVALLMSAQPTPSSRSPARPATRPSRTSGRQGDVRRCAWSPALQPSYSQAVAAGSKTRAPDECDDD